MVKPKLLTHGTPWAIILIKVGQLDKAEELYSTLLAQTSNPNDHGRYYLQLGSIKSEQGDYKEGLRFYDRALEIWQKSLPANHPSLATTYNNIGSAYDYMGEYSRALSFYERALEIWQKSLPLNHPNLKTVLRSMELLKSKSNKK